MPVIEAGNLSKIYNGSKRSALSNVSLAVDAGKIFTLLGRNGAGKTTFIRICATQLLPSSGYIRILGDDILHEPEKVRNLISIVP
jgi:ABC-2 type transport system ATP-binding protein